MQAAESVSVHETVDGVSELLQGNLNIAEFGPKIEPLEHLPELEREVGTDQEEEGEEFEFSFPCVNPDSSPIAAEDAFQDGHIRPIYPFFDQGLLSHVGANSEELAASSSSLHQPLRKLFAEGSGIVFTSASGQSEAEYCPWEGRTVEEIKSSAAWALCWKSNSTGSSKLWKFNDLVRRSISDGKNAFVFLNPAAAPRDGEIAEKKKAAANGGERSEEKAPAAKGRGKGKKAAEAAVPPCHDPKIRQSFPYI